jgi:hypothetical protein
MISVHDAGVASALGELSWFRQEFYEYLTARADALFRGGADGPVHSLVELSLVGEHRRGEFRHLRRQLTCPAGAPKPIRRFERYRSMAMSRRL